MENSFIEFSQSLLKLNKEKKFSDTLNYFKQHKSSFTDQQIAENGYVVSAVLTALRHTSNFEHAFKFIERYKITFSETTKEMVINAYGWVLYFKFKAENLQQESWQGDAERFDDDENQEDNANFTFSKSEIIDRIEKTIPLLLRFDNEYAYSVVSGLFNLVIKAEKKKLNANWKLISDICDLIPPEKLHTDCRTIEVERKGEKKPMELASDRENWFAFKSKALMKSGRFQECFEISKNALESFETFHYSNDVWFARRIALSKMNLGNVPDAITELEKVLRRKKEWFIQKELAVLYHENGNPAKAFSYAIQAITNFGDLEYKVDLLFLLGELLKARNENELAFKHFSLSRLIRIKEGWNIPQKLTSALSQFEIAVVQVEKFQELKNELKKYWATFNALPKNPKVNINEKMTGKIDKILHNDEKGADGFIRFDGRKTIYFRVNATDAITQRLNPGLEVEFKILPATSDKKEKAVQLKIK